MFWPVLDRLTCSNKSETAVGLSAGFWTPTKKVNPSASAERPPQPVFRRETVCSLATFLTGKRKEKCGKQSTSPVCVCFIPSTHFLTRVYDFLNGNALENVSIIFSWETAFLHVHLLKV